MKHVLLLVFFAACSRSGAGLGTIDTDGGDDSDTDNPTTDPTGTLPPLGLPYRVLLPLARNSFVC